MSDGLDLTPPDPDSAGCLCVVASFVSAARTIDEVTAEAAKRAMMSPVLSDFIEFRYADLGPQPGQAGDRSAAIQRVTDALLNPQSIAGRNYFAVVVVDKSAAVVERVLTDCAASPFLAALRMRFLGIANSDDRPGRGLVREAGSFPDVVASPTGVWSKKEDLVDVLRRFADELQRHFSARHEPGLSAEELGELRVRYRQHTAPQLAPDPSQGRDMLAGDPGSAQAAGTQTPRDQQAQVPQDFAEQLASNAQQPPQHQHPQSQSAGQEAGEDASAAESVPSGQPESAGPVSRARRWFPELRRRRGQQPEVGEPEGAPQDAEPKAEGLIYLLIVGDERCRDEAALNRSRSALLEIDKKIAELPGFAYQVRMLYGDEDGLRGDLREAGQLGRRDVKRTVASVDFAAVLESVRASLKRDRVPLKSADATAWPAVVFLTPEPPLADTVAAELFRGLAQEASIIWALPKSAKALLSGAFTDAPGVQVIADDPAVADEIAALLSSGADPVATGA
jgi:hypothetical protein